MNDEAKRESYEEDRLRMLLAIEKLEEQCDLLTKENKGYQNQIGNLEKSLITEKEEKFLLIRQCEEVRNQKEIAESKVQLLQEHIEKQSKDLSSIVNNIEDKDRKISDLNAQIRKYEGIMCKKHEDSLEQITEKKRLMDVNHQLEAHIEDVDLALEQMLNRNNELIEIIHDREIGIQQLEYQIAEEQRRNERYEREIHHIRSKDNVAFSNSDFENSTMQGQTFIEVQQKLIEAKNIINDLKFRLEESQKEASRSQSLQNSLDQVKRQYRELLTAYDQKTLELESDRKAIDVFGQQIADYRERIEEMDMISEQQFAIARGEILFYKEKATILKKENFELIENVQSDKIIINELRDMVSKLESNTYGLPEAVQENSMLRSMLSQRHAAIADMIQQLSLYEKVINAMESNMNQGVDVSSMINRIFDDDSVPNPGKTDHAAVNIMKRAIARLQLREQAQIEIITENDPSLSPPKKLDDNIQSLSSMQLKNNKRANYNEAAENYVTIPSYSRNDPDINRFKPSKNENTLNFNDLPVQRIDFGVQFDNAETMVLNSNDVGLESNRDQAESILEIRQNLNIVKRERLDLMRRVALYKAELENTQVENRQLITRNEDLQRLIETLQKSMMQEKLKENIEKTKSKNIIIPPLPLSQIAENQEYSDGPSPTHPINSVDSERNNDPMRNNIDDSMAIFNLEAPYVQKREMPMSFNEFDLSPPTEIINLKPKTILACDICILSKGISTLTVEPVSTLICVGIDNTPELSNIPVVQSMKITGTDVSILVKQDWFQIFLAQQKAHQEEVGNLQRKSSQRKLQVKEISEQIDRSERMKNSLMATISELKEQLNKQRQDFHERLLQMKNEADRYVQLEREEMKNMLSLSEQNMNSKGHERTKQLDDVSRLISQLEREKNRLESMLEESQDSLILMKRDNSELLVRIRSLESENRNLESQISDNSKIQDYQRYATSLKKKLTETEQKFKQISDENEGLKRKKSSRIETLMFTTPPEKTNLALTHSPSSNSVTSTPEQSKSKKMQSQIDELKQKNTELETTLKKSIENTNRLQKLIQSKESMITSANEEKLKLKQKLLQAQQKIETLESLCPTRER